MWGTTPLIPAHIYVRMYCNCYNCSITVLQRQHQNNDGDQDCLLILIIILVCITLIVLLPVGIGLLIGVVPVSSHIYIPLFYVFEVAT